MRALGFAEARPARFVVQPATSEAFDVFPKTEYLRTSGWRVLRVRNDDVYQSFGAIEAQIISAIRD